MPESPPDTSQAVSAPVGQVRLKPRKARPFYARHPWVLRNAIATLPDGVQTGDVVDLVNDQHEFIARGLYHETSRIAVRLYSWDAHQTLDADFWRQRIDSATALRKTLGYLQDADGACRLIFSEADGMSGLIVDRYGPYLVVQFSSLAMARRSELLLDLLFDAYQPEGMVVRADTATSSQEGIDFTQQTRGDVPEHPTTIREHGISYLVDLRRGQKTGFYLDQRENRRAAAALMPGRRVLDLFSYSGSFGLSALLLGDAREVVAVDSSARALEWARQNAELNQAGPIRFEQANVFHAMDRLKDQGERFDAVILDPPRFSRGKRTINEAIRAYHRINRVALDLLSDDGILVTCSCSGSIAPEDFALMLAGVAEKSRRSIQMLQRRGASPDHPVRTSCLENEYLKCILARVSSE